MSFKLNWAKSQIWILSVALGYGLNAWADRNLGYEVSSSSFSTTGSLAAEYVSSPSRENQATNTYIFEFGRATSQSTYSSVTTFPYSSGGNNYNLNFGGNILDDTTYTFGLSILTPNQVDYGTDLTLDNSANNSTQLQTTTGIVGFHWGKKFELGTNNDDSGDGTDGIDAKIKPMIRLAYGNIGSSSFYAEQTPASSGGFGLLVQIPDLNINYLISDLSLQFQAFDWLTLSLHQLNYRYSSDPNSFGFLKNPNFGTPNSLYALQDVFSVSVSLIDDLVMTAGYSRAYVATSDQTVSYEASFRVEYDIEDWTLVAGYMNLQSFAAQNGAQASTFQDFDFGTLGLRYKF